MYILRVQTKTRHVYSGPTNLHHYTLNSHINSGRILLRSKHAARLHTNLSLFLFTSFRKNPSWKVTLSFRSEFFLFILFNFFFNCSDLLMYDTVDLIHTVFDFGVYCWFFVRFFVFFFYYWFVCNSYIVVSLINCKMW